MGDRTLSDDAASSAKTADGIARMTFEAFGKSPRLAVGIGAAAYGIFAAVGFVTSRDPAPVREAIVAGMLGVAFAGARRWPALAAAATAALAFVEMTISLVEGGSFYTPPPLGYPAIVAAVGLVFGGRSALLTAVGSGIAMPAAVFGHRWVHGLTLLTQQELYFLLSAEMVIVMMFAITVGWSSATKRVLISTERARRRYHALFSEAPDGLVELDRDGRIVEANPAAIRLLGREGGQLVGSRLAEVLALSGAPQPVEIATARPAAPLELELAPVDGRPRVLELTTRAAALAADPRSLIAIRDVSERHEARQRLDHSQRLEIVGRLAGQVAHDFNNLLTAVGGNASLLAELPDPRARQLATEIVAAQHRGVVLTRQLLAFARRDPRQAVPLDLREVVESASPLLSRVLGEQHTLALEGSEPAPIEADRGQLEQVLLNLVANARDALPQGGPVIVAVAILSRREAEERGSNLDGERQILLEVRDRGSGMAPETLAHAFEPFFTTKPRGRGTGLGLAAVNGIVSQNAGHVTIESQLGHGTTVRVFFPFRCGAIAQVAAPPVSSAPEVNLGRGGRIMVVDDDPLVIAVTSRVLRKAGYDVVEASDGVSAQAAFTTSVDLLLTDVAMPGLPGPALAAKLRGCAPGLRVLFMSGYVDPTGTAEHGQPDPADLIAKPFRASELLSRVHECLTRPARRV